MLLRRVERDRSEKRRKRTWIGRDTGFVNENEGSRRLLQTPTTSASERRRFSRAYEICRISEERQVGQLKRTRIGEGYTEYRVDMTMTTEEQTLLGPSIT
jgi:hypothetical protein